MHERRNKGICDDIGDTHGIEEVAQERIRKAYEKTSA